jgi:hypothetical protein
MSKLLVGGIATAGVIGGAAWGFGSTSRQSARLESAEANARASADWMRDARKDLGFDPTAHGTSDADIAKFQDWVQDHPAPEGIQILDPHARVMGGTSPGDDGGYAGRPLAGPLVASDDASPGFFGAVGGPLAVGGMLAIGGISAGALMEFAGLFNHIGGGPVPSGNALAIGVAASIVGAGMLGGTLVGYGAAKLTD